MKAPTGNTALLFFARTSIAEKSAKRIFSTEKKNKPFHHLLRLHAYQEANKTSLSIFQFTEENQKGNSFGEKLANAYQEVFSKGFENVISIGSDCPNLSYVDIEKAAKKLQTKDLVLGPDQRGGAYLIGVSNSFFDRQSFKALPWQTADLFHAFIQLAHTKGIGYKCLAVKFDINVCEDINAHLNRSAVLKKVLSAIFKELNKSYSKEKPLTYPSSIAAVKHRGPPRLSSN